MAQTLTCPRCNQQYGRTKDGSRMVTLAGPLHYSPLGPCPQCGVPMRRHDRGPVEDASPSGAEVVVNG